MKHPNSWRNKLDKFVDVISLKIAFEYFIPTVLIYILVLIDPRTKWYISIVKIIKETNKLFVFVIWFITDINKSYIQF